MANECDIYRSLTVDFPDLAKLIEARRIRGLEEHNGREFSPDLKEDWGPDSEEELGDAMIYISADISKADQRKRVSADAYAAYLMLRSARRKIADAIWEMRLARELNGWPPPKRRRL